MQWNYLLGALALSTVFYWITWAIVNFFREENSPKKHFVLAVKKLLTDNSLAGVERWFLAENILAVILLFSFSTVIYYKAWTTGMVLDVNHPSLISFSALLLLSFFCCIPLMFWSLQFLNVIALFTGNSIDIVSIHWLKWLQQVFRKEDEKQGCLGNLLLLAHFLVLVLQFLFAYVFCLTVLSIAFAK